jgi:hypothetical protein
MPLSSNAQAILQFMAGFTGLAAALVRQSELRAALALPVDAYWEAVQLLAAEEYIRDHSDGDWLVLSLTPQGHRFAAALA